jgi:F-type H+-transporting ATPase subunit delta
MPLIDSQPDAIARVYARSLFELSFAQGGQTGIEEVLGELEEILDIARADPRFAEFLSTPAIGTAKRAASIDHIFKGRVSDLTLRFLQVVNHKGRISALGSIAAAFDNIAQERFGRVEVDVFTAAPLTGDQVRDMRDRLGRALGKDVIVHPYTEGAMIGGVKFRIGDQLIDASLATRLRQMKERLDINGTAALRSRISGIFEDK